MLNIEFLGESNNLPDPDVLTQELVEDLEAGPRTIPRNRRGLESRCRVNRGFNGEANSTAKGRRINDGHQSEAQTQAQSETLGQSRRCPATTPSGDPQDPYTT
jgi:hypothetical protein